MIEFIRWIQYNKGNKYIGLITTAKTNNNSTLIGMFIAVYIFKSTNPVSLILLRSFNLINNDQQNNNKNKHNL